MKMANHQSCFREQKNRRELNEDFMIAANECVAGHIYYMNLPFIYRVHE